MSTIRILAAAVLCGVGSAAASEFEPTVVPWKGIRNSIYAGPYLPNPGSYADLCGGCVIELPVYNSMTIFLPPQNRVTKGSLLADGQSGEALWRMQLGAERKLEVRNKAIVRRSGPGKGEVKERARWKAARVGSRLGEGSLVTAGDGASIDLFLGDNGPVVRVTENSEAELVRMDRNRNESLERVVDTMIDLKRGRILGNVKKLASESSYLVRTRGAVIRVKGTEYAIFENGRCEIVMGEAEVFTEREVFRVRTGEVYEPGGVR